MPSFAVLLTDQGHRVSLTAFAPSLVKVLLKKAVLRGLEWDLGARLNLSKRACADGILHLLNSGRFTLFQKGCIRVLFCDAVYTRTRAVSLGYKINNLCQLCLAAPDTLRHRLWECEAVEEL
eukprot:7339780-Pyramimonas_sp.AAC.1